MADVGASKVAGGGAVVEEGGELRGDFGEDVFWWIDGEVGEVVLGEIVDHLGKLVETVGTREKGLLESFLYIHVSS